MTDLMQFLILGSVGFVAYVFAVKQITKFMMNGGKTPEQIIEKHKNDTNKRFLIKYPEADIKTSKHFILAFSFIFVFVSSIYAFSIIGKGVEKIVLPPLVPEGTEIECIDPFKIQKKKKEEKLEELKKETKKSTEISTVPDEEILPPDVDKGIQEVDSFIDTDFVDGEIMGGEEKLKVESHPVLMAEKMPRFKGCEGILDEDAAMQCTHEQIQKYISSMDIPYSLDEGGKVWIEFIVGKKGQIQKMNIKRGSYKYLDKIVIKHMKKMPNFESGGSQNGMPVSVIYNVPVNIVIE